MPRLAPTGLAAGLLLLAAGLMVELPAALLPRAHLRALALLAVGALTVALPLARLTRRPAALWLAAFFALLHLGMVGVAPVLAVALLALGALALGAPLVAAGDGTKRVDPTLALLVGLALLAGVAGWLLPLRIHRDWSYGALLLVLIWRRREALAGALAAIAGGARRAVARAPAAAAFAVLVLGLASAACWLPTMQHDDLAYHLGLPSELAALGYYRLDASSQVWALAPWAGDLLHGIAALLAGGEARGSLNLLWLAASAWLLFGLTRRLGGAPALAWLAVALWASQPLLAMLLGGMQTELPASAAVFAFGGLLGGRRGGAAESAARLRVLALLAGLLLALKASHALLLAALAAWWLAGVGLRRLPWRALAGALPWLLLAGGSSYAYAFLLSGNPLLPLFNAWFRSPDFPPVNFADPRFPGGLALLDPWRLVFDTGRFFEGLPGGAGFLLIALAGLLPAALLGRRTRAPALVALAGLVALWSQTNYLRYLFPALGLLLAALLAAIGRLRGRLPMLALGVLAGVQLAFQGNAWWVLEHGALARLIREPDPEGILARYAPERLLLRDLPAQARVLVLGRASHAELAGRGFAPSWYDPGLAADPRWTAPAEAGREPLLEAAWDYGFTHLLLAGHPDPAALAERLRRVGATPAGWRYDAILWALPLAPDHPRRDLRRERDRARAIRRAWR